MVEELSPEDLQILQGKFSQRITICKMNNTTKKCPYVITAVAALQTKRTIFGKPCIYFKTFSETPLLFIGCLQEGS